MKVCRVCRKDSGGKYHCNDCREKHNERTKIARRERKKNGICTSCGKERDTNFRQCSTCQTKSTNRVREQNKRRKQEGMCNIISCENFKSNKSRFCEKHRLERLKYAKKRDLKLINGGLCTSCASEKYMNCFNDKFDIHTKVCQTCYLKLLSARYFNTVDKWNELLDLLVKQNYKCPYTGDILVLAINDSIDHILPQDKYPDRKQDINNMQWITRPMNNMKHKLLEHEFLIEIIKVVKNMGDDLYTKATPHKTTIQL